uniref:Olfactory receptor family 9 subfamily I member 1 n=1 Tax=Chinchilla lanigera TaxID=34839 RepID=A0A8C2YNB9_CHILA
MAHNNLSSVAEFMLMGFTDHPNLEIPLFLVFLSFYLVTLLGNMGMVILIRVDAQLHTPMYFFLSHLALLDACYTSPRICWSLVVGAYVCGVSGSILRTTCTFSLSFCEDNHINFFFCDLPPLLKLACSDTANAEIIIVVFGNFVILANALVILISYLLIIKAILKVKSPGGRAKTFSTCASHLSAVALFFGTLTFMYIRSSSGKSLEEDKVVSVFYTVVVPMLNPLIYSLRNKDVKAAFRKVTGRFQVSQSV